jgi:hypothetical protein
MALRHNATAGCLVARDGVALVLGAADAVTLHRDCDDPDPSRPDPIRPDPIRHSDLVALRLGASGFLVAGPAAGPAVTLVPEPVLQWHVTGGTHGAGIGADRAIGLFNLVHGDFLVAPASGTVPAWWSDLDGGLPIPGWGRPARGRAGDVELSGAAVQAVDGDPAAGLLLLLDPGVAGALAAHLAARAPTTAAALAPGGRLSAVACRRPGVDVPAAGARLWVQGPLSAQPGPSIDPVRTIAWALDADGHEVDADPTGAAWPREALTWHAVRLSAGRDASATADGPPSTRGDDVPTWLLPLPAADGESGSTTTFTLQTPPGRAAGLPPSIVHDPRTGRRALRLELPGPAGAGTEPVRVTCAVRVHRRAG